MPSLTLIGDSAHGTSGVYTLPMASFNNAPSLSNHASTIINGVTYHYWSTILRASSTTMNGGVPAFDIPNGIYHVHDENSGYHMKVSLSATGQYQFGPLYVGDTNVGRGSGGGGVDVSDRYAGVCEISSSYGTALAFIHSRESASFAGYYAQYAFCFDGIADIITPDTPPTPPDPYAPPSGQAGNDSAAGGGGSGGGGYPTGTNTGTPDNKKNRAGVGCNIYLCSATAVKAFTKMLWGSTNTGFIDAFFKRVQNAVYNPIDSIITCHSLPSAFAPQGTIGTEGIKAGGVDFSTYDANCVGAPISTEWVHAGPFNYVCDETWGNYSDYKNTTVHLYLPFCGIVPLDTSLFFGYNGTSHLGIKVDYWCNLLNGNCAAYVTTIDREGDEKLIKVATGNCAQPCPLSGNDRGMQQKLGALFGFAQSLPSAITSGSALGILAGVISPAIGAIGQDITASRHTNVVGSLNGAAGFAAATDIQIVFDIPIPINSENYSLCRGRPSEVSRAVGEYVGHCELEVHADSVNYATDEEKREIEKICLTGILI